MSHREFSGSFPAPDRTSLPKMYTNGDHRLRHLPPMLPSPPPPKRQKSESTPASDAGHSRYYSHSVGASEQARSRQPSTAMDLYTLIDRDPVDKDPRRNARFTSSGSVATQASQVSNTSQVSRSSPVIFSDHKYVFPRTRLCIMTDSRLNIGSPKNTPATRRTVDCTMVTARAFIRSRATRKSRTVLIFSTNCSR